MDKVEEWMRKVFNNKSPQAKAQPQVEQKDFRSQKKQKFQKRKQNAQTKKVTKKLIKKGHKTIHDFELINEQNHAQNNRPNVPQKKKKGPSPIIRGKLKIIPLGGLNEVGKNMMAFEYEDDIIIVDMGFEFPGEDMLGVDYVIPDITYLEENKKRIRGVLLTHGHLDHIGGIPYMIPKLDFPPLFGTKLTMGLVQKRIEEFDQQRMTKLNVIDPNKPLRLGKFLVNFFRVAHSIPDGVGIIIDTPIGKIVHTGDFKFDDHLGGLQKPADINKMRALGHNNVLALFSDSTNALKPGHTMSEKQIGETLEDLIKNTEGRLIIASFSSLIGRIQQVIDAAQKYSRKIFISGRSMQDNISIATRLGYLKIPEGLIRDIKKYKNISDRETIILTTGSQGEAVSALARISDNEHAQIKVKKGDTIVLSSSPIVGNERPIYSMINKLCLLGAHIIHNQIMDVHTSGHGYQDELRQMIDFIRPKYFIPVHGEYFMRQAHALIAKNKCRIPEDQIIMVQNGDVLLAERNKVYKSNEKVETKYILIDGLGEGQSGSYVQIEREIMSQNGVLIILIHVSKKNKKLLKIPDIVSRGYIYMHETELITKDVSQIAGDAYRKITEKNPGASRNDIKKYIRQTIDQYTRNMLDRRPLIVPLIIEE